MKDLSLLKMKIAVLAFAMLAFVCLSQAGEFNGTIYRLSSTQVQVTQPVNASIYNLTLHEKAGDLVFIGSDGLETAVNSSYSYWAGEHKYKIDFGGNVIGDLVYTIPYQGQQFILPLKESHPVKVILPPGYTTGDHILGIAKPQPDQIMADKNGTELTWNNPGLIIDVGYYQENAPDTLKKIFALLAVMAVIVLIEYYASIKRLRAISREAEKKAKGRV
jgi:hypothetical protein